MSFAPLTGEALAASTAPLSLPTQIVTERLRLVPWQERHLDRLSEMHGDRDTMRFMGGQVSRSGCWRGMAEMLGQWEMLGYGIYAVEDVHGTFVGRCGLYHPLNWPERELGYCFHADARGQGYATEAVRAVRDAVRDVGVARLISLISPQNLASKRVAERLGARPSDSGSVPDGFVVRYLHDMTKPKTTD